MRNGILSIVSMCIGFAASGSGRSTDAAIFVAAALIIAAIPSEKLAPINSPEADSGGDRG